MKPTDIFAAALINLILFMGLQIVLLYSGAGGWFQSTFADAALDGIERTSRKLGEKETTRILDGSSEDGAVPAIRPLPSLEEMKSATDINLVADALVPAVRRELRVQRRKADVLTIAAPVLAFAPFGVLVVLARVRSASAARAPEPDEETGSNE